VESAIDTIAELGYAGASFARIARRAGLSSTRLISYHFAEKDDLMREVLHTVVARFTDYVRPRAEGEDSPRRRLIAALEANVDFIAGHRRDVVTLHEIERNYRTADGRPVLQQQAEDDLQTIASWLREGQRQGELREFDPDAVAVLILALRNGVIQRYHVEPGLSLPAVKRELIDMVDLATRRAPAASAG